ncbi:hypothetical protein C5L14_06170 [Labrys okinawensis]|uniref:Metallo-beta-lactamase domain-containing protein n=1 Tax=Labrys okinawensis TaxID=346911 RepID=A0A2S9QHN6_9HYPH|nr:hypothetical protein [Labrys okinawensis]PRH88800.1 hypothetical protein C5L14_06170 [Labrys okinawensis]
MPVFRLAMHPASEGDALMLSWGEEDALHRALIDLGRTKNYRALKPLLQTIGTFELFAISHIDADHIEGAVPLFAEPALPFTARNVWFNAYSQLVDARERLRDAETLGVDQAEKVTAGIKASGWPWNSQFASRIVSTGSPEAAAPLTFAGGLKLTLLSPTDQELTRLLPTWERALAEAHLRKEDKEPVELAETEGREILGSLNVEALAARQFSGDGTRPNGSSIAFIAEFDQKRVLMAADSHADVIEAALERLGHSAENPLRLDCLKVSHHGSKANTSPAVLSLIDCTRFAFSTDGSHHGHPDAETIARILKHDPGRRKTLIFNFRQPSTEQWDDENLRTRWHYDCLFPEAGKEGIEFEL